MDQETHQVGLQVLKDVLLRRAVIGMYFSGSNLWFNDPENPLDRYAYLRIENGWALLRGGDPGESVPTNLLRDYRELAAVAARLSESRVWSIHLGFEHGHLWLTFESGDTLFVNGKDESYESWELRCGDNIVVALAGGDLAVWLSDSEATPMAAAKPSQAIPEWQEIIWRFLRGDLPTDEFEQWAYNTERLQSLMSSDLYLELLEINYQDKEQVHELAKHLGAWIDRYYPRSCDCPTWKDSQTLSLGFDRPVEAFLSRFQVLIERTPWIDLVRCKHCGQPWYLAIDTVDDDYYMQRLTESDVQAIERNQWPTTFDHIKSVWPDQKWLNLCGFASLAEWQSKHRT